MAGSNVVALAALSRREARRRAYLTVPALALVAFCLAIPLSWLLWESVRGPNGWTLEYYRVVGVRPAYLGYLKTTFQISFWSTLLCVLLGYPFSYGLVVLSRRFSNILLAAVVVSFFASYLVRAYAWLLLIARYGIVNTFLKEHGLIDAPLQLAYSVNGTLLGMVHVLLPLMVLPLYASMRSVDTTLLAAAASLGAPPARAFRDVFLPLSLPGVVAGAVLVFILSVGFYLTPAILGGGTVVVWATAIATAAQEDPEWGASSALGIILLVATLVLLYALKRLFKIERLFRAGA